MPGLPLHVIQRGVDRARCFRSQSDRSRYLELLEEAAFLSKCSIHAYVLMDNHVHLLASPQEPASISKMMKRIGERYVQGFNKRHGRTGTLWEGRFRSSLVETERYFLHCQRYIELNPVRAGLVRHPHDHPWSSYRANAEGATSFILAPHPQYLALASTELERREAYRRLFAGAIPGDLVHRIRVSINSGAPLADEEFIVNLERQTGCTLSRGKRVRLPIAEIAGSPTVADTN
ncbi:MAG TPA: transposase [Usitatibacter sp.]|nr:transposase [Usitatibacter sp.]